MNRENHFRSIAKGVTWRMIGTLDTIFLSYLFTGHAVKALKIGGVELFTKIALFWLHERVWLSINFGLDVKEMDGKKVRKEKQYRSLVKGITWRIIGSLDTFWIALVINQDSPTATETAFYISTTEIITKIALFWLHERVWLGINWGKKTTVPVEL